MALCDGTWAGYLLTSYLTVNDLQILKRNGLEAPGFLSLHYADEVIEVIDKVVPPDRQTAALYQQDLETVQQRAAQIRYTSEKIESLASEGPHALGGRVVGATTAAIAGKDVVWGGEAGAFIGGARDIRMQLRRAPTHRNVRPAAQADEPVSGGTANVGRPSPREPVPQPDPMPKVTPPLKAPVQQEEAPTTPPSAPTAKPATAAAKPKAPVQPKPLKPPKDSRGQSFQGIPEKKPSTPKGTNGGNGRQSNRKTTTWTSASRAFGMNSARRNNARLNTKPHNSPRARRKRVVLPRSFWNKSEELYVLERARAHPERTILEQVRFVGVTTPDGKLTAATDIAGKGRTLDFLELDRATVLGGEVKSRAEIVHSVENLKDPGMEGGFKPTTSRGVGEQRGKEKSIIDDAVARGGNLKFEGKDVRTGQIYTVVVAPQDYRSTVVAYDQLAPD